MNSPSNSDWQFFEKLGQLCHSERSKESRLENAARPRFLVVGASWEKQVPGLLAAGHRVITYDRRGFGKSSQPTAGYNYDTSAEEKIRVVEIVEKIGKARVAVKLGSGLGAVADRLAMGDRRRPVAWMLHKPKHWAAVWCKPVYEYLFGGVACDPVTSARTRCEWR